MDKFQLYEKRIARHIGGLFKIPLTHEYSVYAQYLTDWTFAVYDYLSNEQAINYCSITSQPVLFRVSVMHLVFRRDSRWLRVATCIIPEHLKEPALFCRKALRGRDPVSQELLYSYHKVVNVADEELIPISEEECDKMKLSAVWNPSNIVERLQKHYQVA